MRNTEEYIFVKIKLNKQDNLLVGLIYRSPSGSEESENNANLLKLINEATGRKFSQVLMMGDFNFPNGDWESWNNKSDNTETQDYKFIQCIQDNFLHQHVNKPTRWRGTDTPHVLDLVFTNEENMVSELEYLSPLGKSDHCVLQFQFNCYTKLKIDRRQTMCYDKGTMHSLIRR